MLFNDGIGSARIPSSTRGVLARLIPDNVVYIRVFNYCSTDVMMLFAAIITQQ